MMMMMMMIIIIIMIIIKMHNKIMITTITNLLNLLVVPDQIRFF